MKELEHQVMFTHWEPYDAQNFVCRFVTSWATTDEDLNILSEII
jgi:threonine aldolase